MFGRVSVGNDHDHYDDDNNDDDRGADDNNDDDRKPRRLSEYAVYLYLYRGHLG